MKIDRSRREKKEVKCYKCGCLEHYSNECCSRERYVHYTGESEYKIKSEYTSEEKYEVYINQTFRSDGKCQTRKKVRTNNKMETDEEYTIPEVPKEVINLSKTKEKRKEQKFKMKPAPIEQVTEFDISQYIKELSCGLSIGQAST